MQALKKRTLMRVKVYKYGKSCIRPAHFKDLPQFAGMSDTQLGGFSKKSGQILNNSENSCIDEDTRLIWFYLLVAHYAQLQDTNSKRKLCRWSDFFSYRAVFLFHWITLLPPLVVKNGSTKRHMV